MSDRSIWKMLHLLYTLPPGKQGLSDRELREVGIDCYTDTVQPLVQSQAVIQQGNVYSLSAAASELLRTGVLANRRWSSDDLWVDYPAAFVVMPFGESWSSTVYSQMIKPAVEKAGLECIRGDTVIRMGDLTQNIWGALMHAGIIIAEVSVINANVFYEIGLAHALGKDSILLKQAQANLPADISGAHYHEYCLDSLSDGETSLSKELANWGVRFQSAAVKALHAP